ncbi:hypothetical protein BC939DRAFT_117804 [Gamsiella multidivaricata]|uniref:uncharacterized protein n=1 Tax=Gamsiella multidivaricata TaxID=101098 RepID=UPI002220F945|nr:uncharacterized protein BC939DRAFT_117804 [Gamsiella multidivaricata]KAI7825979.1 hypothetical protein BC939DRAFT_117804 [Gamsiella multidivaricata]
MRSTSDSDTPNSDVDDDNAIDQLNATLQRMPCQDLMSVTFLLNHLDEQEVSYIPTDKNIVDEIRQPVSESLGATEDDVAVRSEYSITQAVKAMQQMTFFRQLQDCDTQKLVSMCKKTLQASQGLLKKRVCQTTVHGSFTR